MGKRFSQEEVARFLSDVAPEKNFWINNGPIVGNLNYLLEAIETIDEETFKHHVNDSKNDFATWINEVIGYPELASRLLNAKTKKSFLKKLRKGISYLKPAQ